MLETLLLSAALMAPADDRAPSPSRGVNRFMDSGHQVWARTPSWIRHLSLCIRRHESINAGHYDAANPTSTARGAYQFLRGTWQGNAKWAKWNGKYVARGYATADAAPAWVQDVVFIHSIQRGGIKAWRGTGCPGTA